MVMKNTRLVMKTMLVLLLGLCFITNSISCLAAKKAVKYKRSTGKFYGPFLTKQQYTQNDFEATVKIDELKKISIGSLLHFDVSKSMDPARITICGYLENSDSGDYIKKVPENKITRNIAYRKPVEEFQSWGTGYLVCRKGTWCKYCAVADNFPDGLDLKVYFCLTNYSPSEVTNKMMK